MNITSNAIPVGPCRNILTDKIAIDCEMMRSNIGQVLGRVSVVNYESETIFDTFVCYPKPIVITNTKEEFSGIAWNDVDPQNGAQLFSDVQAQLVELLRDRIVIGHDIQKYFKPTSIVFNMTIRDTQKYSRYRQYANHGAHQGPSLKNLALAVLGRQIKQGRASSMEDAVDTLKVYRNAEADINREQAKQGLSLWG